MSGVDSATVQSTDGTRASELTLFLRTDLFYINIQVFYGTMLHYLMLLDTECFPSFKMYLAFPWNRINNRADNMLSIPYTLSDWFFILFIHKRTVLIVVYNWGNISQNIPVYSPTNTEGGCDWDAGNLRGKRPLMLKVSWLEPQLMMWLWFKVHY